MASNLLVYREALEMVRLVHALLPVIRRQDKHLADQASRASKGVPLNIVEAVSRTGRDRGHLLTVALGSTRETHAAMDVAWATGIITEARHHNVAIKADRVARLLVGMNRA